jgi:hypothetical protein
MIDMGERGVDTIDAAPPPTADESRATYVDDVVEEVRVLIVAGIPVGVLVAGVGSRLAMFLLRATSSDHVRGIESDDGFTIGEVTLGGTYNLVLLGATIGIIGAGAYQWVRRWLLGPTWFRRLTVGAGCGAVVGSMLIHADGVDFSALTPTWLAIGLFVALPAVFGLLIGPTVDRVEQPTSWTVRGRFRWLLPVVLVVVFPLSLITVAIASLIIAIWCAMRDEGVVRRLRDAAVTGVVVRAFWLLVAIAGLFALMGDIADIGAIT